MCHWSVRHTSLTLISSLSHVFSGTDIQNKTLTFTEDNIDVFINGAKVREDEFTANANTNTVTINNDVSLEADDNVLITTYEPFSLSDVPTKIRRGYVCSRGSHSAQRQFLNGGVDINSDVDIDGHVDISADVLAAYR